MAEDVQWMPLDRTMKQQTQGQLSTHQCRIRTLLLQAKLLTRDMTHARLSLYATQTLQHRPLRLPQRDRLLQSHQIKVLQLQLLRPPHRDRLLQSHWTKALQLQQQPR